MGLSKYLHKSIVEWRKHIAVSINLFFAFFLFNLLFNLLLSFCLSLLFSNFILIINCYYEIACPIMDSNLCWRMLVSVLSCTFSYTSSWCCVSLFYFCPQFSINLIIFASFSSFQLQLQRFSRTMAKVRTQTIQGNILF